jgi:hypothetical protein
MSLLSERELARTYSPAPGVDPYERLQRYRETRRYPDDWGSQRVATDMGVSRETIQAWVDDGSKPDAARAVGVAEDRGWLATEWTPTVRALGMLVIGVYACGSVSAEHHRPSWLPGNELAEATIRDALAEAGVGVSTVERSDRSHTDELRPGEHSSPLGRALVVASAPVGVKTAETVSGLPYWLAGAPASVRASAAELLVAERGVEHDGKATRRIQTDRPAEYFADFAALVEDVTGEAATASKHGVTVSADAVRALGLS